MIISFDQDKREANMVKHGLDLADGGIVLRGPTLDKADDDTDRGEDRWIAIGLLGARAVVCVWAEPGDQFRIISLRNATNDERRRLDAHLAATRRR